MNIHLLTEVSTYVETGGRASDAPLTAQPGQASLLTMIQIDAVDPNTGTIGPPTNPVRDGDFVALRTRFGELLEVSGGALRSIASVFVPSVPLTIFRIQTIDGEPNGAIAHGDRVAIRRIERVPPVGPVFATVDMDSWLTVNRTPPHAITFRTLAPHEHVTAAEGFRFLVPVDARGLRFRENAARVPYQGNKVAEATLTATAAGLPGGTLFRIDVSGDTEFAAATVLEVTLPADSSSMPVDITIGSHHGKLDGCETKQLFFRVTAEATDNAVDGDPLLLEAGHVPFMVMRERSQRWATPENQGCLGRLLPGFLTPLDLMIDAELLLRDGGVADSDLPVINVAFSSADPAVVVFPTSSTLTYDTPIPLLIAVKDARRQAARCGSIRVNFDLAGGTKPMEARFAILFRAGAVALDPFAHRI
jgi:hypothetical protein